MFTGSWIEVQVSHLTTPDSFGHSYGIKPGWVCMSINCLGKASDNPYPIDFDPREKKRTRLGDDETGVWRHDLKIWPKHFQDVWNGIKTFELRLNDRDYQAGDVLRLYEFDPHMSLP